MNRRTFLASLASSAALWPVRALAQTRSKPLVAFLASGSKTVNARVYSAFPQGMRELGYLEGRDYSTEERYADNDLARLPRLADELVRLKPSVIVASPISAAIATSKVTTSIPIVSAMLTDPVGFGLVASEARPQGNVTGILARLDGLPGKLVEIARDLVPGLSKIGILHTGASASAIMLRDMELAAAKLGSISLAPVEVRSAAEIGAAFQTFRREGVGLLMIAGGPLFLAASRQIAAYALAAHLPSVFYYREHVEDGGLLSYGINIRENYRRAAYYVDRILKGDKPADLPIEFPTKLELVINLATARAIGLTVPPTLLARADEVIE